MKVSTFLPVIQEPIYQFDLLSDVQDIKSWSVVLRAGLWIDASQRAHKFFFPYPSFIYSKSCKRLQLAEVQPILCFTVY